MSLTESQKAINKIMDYLARRDHSEKELRTKMSDQWSEEAIEEALCEVRRRGWLLPPAELAQKVAASLHLKKKGIYWINGYLREKGLPEVERIPSTEFLKAKDLLETKFRGKDNLSFKDRQKASAYLKNRGFDGETISQVVSHENYEF